MQSGKQRGPQQLPFSIWALGLVSLFMDASSELVHALLPIYMATTLGASMAAIGFIEGVAEAVAAAVKYFSGAISDVMRRRKPLVVLGYLLAALTKPIFPLAPSLGWVFAARSVDRVGKGVRGAPRDALVADIVPSGLRGAAYGLRQALDSVGAVIGPGLAVLAMLMFASDLRAALWVAVVPAALSVLVMIIAVREPESRRRERPSARTTLSLAGAGQLPGAFWLVIVLVAVFTLARFSEAFLILRAEHIGLAPAWVPLIMVVMNIVYATTAYPVGRAADRMSLRRLLLVGLVLLIVADLLLALGEGVVLVFAGAALWGAHMGFSQGLLAKLVADASPAELRGTAFGIFNLVSALALLLASIVAGLLWDCYGPIAVFLVGGGFAVLATLVLLSDRRLGRCAIDDT